MYPLEKILELRSTHEKKFQTHEIPTRKILNPRQHDGMMARDPRDSRWHKTRGI